MATNDQLKSCFNFGYSSPLQLQIKGKSLIHLEGTAFQILITPAQGVIIQKKSFTKNGTLLPSTFVFKICRIPDDKASHCSSCRKVFSILLRRHHCRCCGGVQITFLKKSQLTSLGFLPSVLGSAVSASRKYHWPRSSSLLVMFF